MLPETRDASALIPEVAPKGKAVVSAPSTLASASRLIASATGLPEESTLPV